LSKKKAVSPRKSWGKKSTQMTWLGILVAISLAIFFQVADKTDRFFALTALALAGYIVYNEWLK
jgi:hypothetical protein